MTLSSSTLVSGFPRQISITWTSRLNQPSDNIFLSSTNTELAIGNVTEFSHCSKFRRRVIDFLASPRLSNLLFEQRLYESLPSESTQRAISQPEVSTFSKYCSGKILLCAPGAFLIYSWFRLMI